MAIHTVTDISNITNSNCIYFGKVVIVGDQFDYTTATVSNGWTVSIDAEGFPSINTSGGIGTDSFTFIFKGDTFEWTFSLYSSVGGTDLENVDYTLVPRISSDQKMSDPSGVGGVYVAPVVNFRSSAVAANSITLGWDKLTVGHSGFEIQYIVDGIYVHLAEPNETIREYQHTGLSPSTDYYYRICAVDSLGNRSAWTTLVASTA